MSRAAVGIVAGVLLLGALLLSSMGAALACGPGGGTSWTPHGMMGPSGMWGGYQRTPTAPTAPAAPTTGTTQVAIVNFAYQPENLQVRVGTTVPWTNQDSAPHTVTFRNGMKDSGMLRQGQSFSYAFTQAGTYAYYCAYHPNMVATVTVTT